MNTRRWAAFLVVLSAALLLSACGFSIIQGSGNIQSETREVSDFTAVDFSGFGELTIVQGDTEGLTIETDDNLHDHIEFNVIDSVLTFSKKARLREKTLRIKVAYNNHLKHIKTTDDAEVLSLTSKKPLFFSSISRILGAISSPAWWPVR